MDSRTALSRSSNVFFSSIYLFVWLRWALVVACGVQFHDQGCKLGPLHWEDTVLATGPPGKPHASPSKRCILSQNSQYKFSTQPISQM